MIKSFNSISKDANSLRNQYELIKDKYLRDKYIIATSCFQLAAQICVCKLFYTNHNAKLKIDKTSFCLNKSLNNLLLKSESLVSSKITFNSNYEDRMDIDRREYRLFILELLNIVIF